MKILGQGNNRLHPEPANKEPSLHGGKNFLVVVGAPSHRKEQQAESKAAARDFSQAIEVEEQCRERTRSRFLLQQIVRDPLEPREVAGHFGKTERRSIDPDLKPDGIQLT